MSEIIQARVTAKRDEPFVVFLIGMRINKPWKVHKWVPVAAAMGRMIRELSMRQDSDLLHFESWGGRTTIMVQYWRSFDALERYAKDQSDEHLPAWRNFNQRVASNGDVGIWHETYMVNPGQFECVYNNMPRFGLAAATQLVPATGKRNGARGRLAAATETTPEPA
jgi:hypothetical protein